MKPLATLYRHFGADGELLYIGISLNALSRLAAHSSVSGWFGKIVRVELEHFEGREQAAAAELAAIKREKPAHNIVGATGRVTLPARRVTPPAGGTVGRPRIYQTNADRQRAYRDRHQGKS